MIENSRFISNSAMDHGGAILCADMELICKNSVFCGNVALGGGGLSIAYSDLNLFNCTITNNRAEAGRFLLNRSQQSDNFPEGIVQIRNCIIRNGGDEILNGYASINLEYSDIEGGQSAITDPNRRAVWSSTNVDIDPYFVDPGFWDTNGTPDDPNDDFFVEGDYHLKSEGGRWTSTSSVESDPVNQAWVRDDVTSPCIDAGDPNSDWSREPFPNGGRINMGAYGGTAEASKSRSSR